MPQARRLSVVWAGLIAVMALGVAGCQSMLSQALPQPKVNVVSVEVVKQTAEGAQLEVVLEAQNPYAEDRDTELLNYRVDVQGFESFTFNGAVPTQALTPDGSRYFTLTAAIATDGHDVSGAAYTVRGQLLYRNPGVINNTAYESGVPFPAVGFSGEGVLQ